MEWFRHDSNANLDDKLQQVLLNYGLEGYGLYWYCIELIVNKVSKDNITFEVKHDARVIARNTGSTPQKVEEMMKHFIELGLFENNHGVITCMKVAKRLSASATSNPQMRQIIHNINQNNVLHLESCQRHDDVMKDKIRLDKKTTNIHEGFDEFWSAYPNRTGKAQAQKAWSKHKPDLQVILDALEWQKETDGWKRGFVPMASTYINNARWEDENPNDKLNDIFAGAI